MKIHIIVVGHKTSEPVAVLIGDYEQRLKKWFDVTWIKIKPSDGNANTVRHKDSDNIRLHIKPDDFVVLLDERGRLYDNQSLAEAFSVWRQKQNLVFVIGGAYGVDQELRQSAAANWSLSSLVMPHQLAQLILIEQLYRTMTIIDGHPYHHI